MRKVAHTILLTSLVVFLIGILPAKLGFQFDFPSIIQDVAFVIGVSALAVGVFKFVLSAFYTSDKREFYQATFCILLGFSAVSFSLWAFVAAVILVTWLDHKKQPLF